MQNTFVTAANDHYKHPCKKIPVEIIYGRLMHTKENSKKGMKKRNSTKEQYQVQKYHEQNDKVQEF